MTELPTLSAEFIGSAVSLSQCPQDDVVEIAFVGRSNAGKSSTLNRVMSNKRLARVSKTPGRTRLINLFSTSWGFRVVDLPGYGYARASQSERANWSAAVDEYLEHRANLHGLVLVMDARHPLKPFDQRMLEWASAREINLLTLLNKADKLKRNAQVRTVAETRRDVAPSESISIQLFSAASGLGLTEAIDWLRNFAELG